MSQPEEASGCFDEAVNTTNILLAGVLDLGSFVGEIESSHSFQYQPTPPNIHSPGPAAIPPLCASMSCPQTAGPQQCDMVQVPCSAQAILLAAPAQAFEGTFSFSIILWH